MVDEQNHYRIVPYLRTPIVDTGHGYPPSHLAMQIKDEYLGLFRSGALRTICLDEWNRPDTVERVWDLLGDGGHIIAGKISNEILKSLKHAGKFRVREENPFFVVQKLSGKGGRVYQLANGRKKEKTVCLARYGALGDHVYMSTIIQHFYDLGYHITYNCTERGKDVYKGDPRIDVMMAQESNVIRNDRDELEDYYRKWSSHFDEYYGFDGIIEGNLLRIEGTPAYRDPWEKRAVECSKNYVDAHFERIGRPDITGLQPAMVFSKKELEWAENELASARRSLGKTFVGVWSMLGSGFHKMYPWTYDVWTLCQANGDDIGFISVGDQALGRMLEDPRFKNVLPRSGKYSIRQTLSLLEVSDFVVSTETNTLIGALGTKETPLIALLSHSSASNYTWRPFDIPLGPSSKDCPCYPCHQLHYSRASCPPGVYEKSATLCMDSITPVDVYNGLLKLMGAKDVRNSCDASS